MPVNWKDYPKNWKEISLAVREAAGWACELCGAEQGKPNPTTGSKVVLTVAHLDHDTKNNDRSNLKALCQRCHLRYDVKHHAATRRRNAMKRKGQLELC